MKLIVGLGNPGDKYDKTRHNLGFEVLDEYAKKKLGAEITWKEEAKFKAAILQISPDLWLVKPQTYMNLSGLAVKALVDYYKIPLQDVVVIHDDLDIPLGKIKIRVGGSAGGHHGVESIINTLGDDKFTRVRLGIGTVHSLRSEHDRQHTDVEEFVLKPFAPGEQSKVKSMLKTAVEAVELLLDKGLETAQNQYN